MSVIITNGDTTFNTTDGFYEVESYNLGYQANASTGLLALSTARFQDVTFAHAGNCQGALWMVAQASACNRSITTRLEENIGNPTLTAASPGVITLASHGLTEGQVVVFSTTGALLTGITSNTIYYVRNPSTDTFNVSTTETGALINLSGTDSGTHTLWVSRAEKTQLFTDIIGGGAGTTSSYRYHGQYLVPAIFDTPYPVTTDAGIWRLDVRQTGGTSGNWSIAVTGVSVNPIYATWCDNAISHTDDDVVIVKDYLTIDKTCSIGGVLGTGQTDTGFGMYICSNVNNPDPDNVAFLKWENPPTSSYTFTCKGSVMLVKYSGIRVGTETNPIPIAQRGIWEWAARVVGTVNPGFRSGGSASGTYAYSGSSLFIYGENPTYAKTNLASDANTGQAHLITTDNVDWVNGDQVAIGKCNTQGQGDTTIYTISSVSSNDITLTGNVATNNRIAGATVMKLDCHGFKLQGTTASAGYIFDPANFVISGCDWHNIYFNNVGTSYYYVNSAILSANRSQYLLQDINATPTSTSITYLIAMVVPPDGALIDRAYCHRMNMASGCVSYYASGHKSGRLTIQNSVCIGQYAGTISTSSNIRLSLIGNSFENARASTYFYSQCGINSVFKNNKIWGSGTIEANGGAVRFVQTISPLEIGGNSYDNNVCAIVFGPSVSLGCLDVDSTFGTETANTIDIGFEASAFPDYTFKSNTGDVVIDETYVPDMVVGGKVAFADYNDTANADRNIFTLGKMRRTGDGLADTTVHTSGSGKFAVRFELTSSDVFSWSYDVPTGNIQNKEMMVGIWVKINSENYWAGTYELPRLTITYDGTSTSYSQAAASTDWQLLFVPITPLTTTGKIRVTLSASSDATSSDSYVYWDDTSILYPAGVTLNLGGMDIWDNALPVTPPISTLATALDVWAVASSTQTGTGTMGKLLVDTKGIVSVNQALLLS